MTLSFALATWLWAVPVAHSVDQDSPPQACTLDSVRVLSGRTSIGLPSRRVELPVGGSEGAEVTVYGDIEAPSIIAASFFGETGKVDIWFVLGSQETFVRHRVSNYSGPFQPGVSVSSTVTSEFVICAGHVPVYPNSRDATAYEDSVRTLALVRSQLAR